VTVSPLLQSQGTLLIITPLSGSGTGLTITPFSARGLTQTLEQVGDPSNIRRDVNGMLHDISPSWIKQYTSTVICKDNNVPVMNRAWRGQVVEVQCCAELNYYPGDTPNRPEVSGSFRSETYPDGSTVNFFRPILIMMVMDIKRNFGEWAAEEQWRIELQELNQPAGYN
jgi:hypothetical protein